MAIAVTYEDTLNQDSFNKVINQLRGLKEEAGRTRNSLQADFDAINDEITEYTSFSYRLNEQLKIATNSLKSVGETSWLDFKTNTGNLVEKALGGTWDAFTDNIGELDNKKLVDAWSEFGDSFVESVHTSWYGMLDNMGQALTGQVKIRPRKNPRTLSLKMAA